MAKVTQEALVAYSIEAKELAELGDKYMKRTLAEDADYVQALGGMASLEEKLGTNLVTGLSAEDDLPAREAQFGSNRRQPVKRRTYIQIVMDTLEDTTMRILIVAGIISLILGVTLDEHKETGWIEGFAILIAVLIVTQVTALNDLQKEKKFAKLQEQNQNRRTVTIIRAGEKLNLHPGEALVGDVIELVTGMALPADGIVISANDLEAMEAAMTGEGDNLKKLPVDECLTIKNELLKDHSDLLMDETDHHHDVPSPLLLSGTNISQGTGRMLVTAVGSNSAEGKILDLTETAEEFTPLQLKLTALANDIGKIGLLCAVLAVVVMYIRFGVELATGSTVWESGKHPMMLVSFFITGITIVVVAIPEGLPLAVTISLAYSVKKMQEDHNLVRRLQACETMGGANQICSDKTGTLTQNSMTVAQMYTNSGLINLEQTKPQMQMFEPEYFATLKESLCLNTSAYITPDGEEVGYKTEIALLTFLLSTGHSDYNEIRHSYSLRPSRIYPFSSKRKRSSIVVSLDPAGRQKRVHVKGASEVVLGKCGFIMDKTGTPIPMAAELRTNIEEVIKSLANQALRTIGIAYRDLPEGFDAAGLDVNGFPLVESEKLVFLAIAGIKDPVREEGPKAVLDCQGAGITVRMVTGDNRDTAKAIARECHIYSNDSQLVMEGVEFAELCGGVVCKHCGVPVCDCVRDSRKALPGQKVREDVVKDMSAFRRIADSLVVLARSRPEDKYTLVTGLKELGHVVAVTGDGTNDAPALKKADIGFAMGIAGTEMAKEAASIILMDDNFASVVKAVMWGRNIYDNIKRFLQFQLTVNVVAVVCAMVGAFTIKQSPLTAVQMLWVNLIMDTLASLALATEPPTEEHLKRKPYKKTEYIISSVMWKHILGQAGLQLAILFTLMFAGEWFLPEDGSGSRVFSNPDSPHYVISGRLYHLDGNEDYKEKQDDPDIGPSRHFTYIFNIFVLMQLCNELNTRKIRDELNIFAGAFRNRLFWVIWVITVVAQVLMVEVGSFAVSCHVNGLTIKQWLVCFGFAFTTLAWRPLLRLIPDKLCPHIKGKDHLEPDAFQVVRIHSNISAHSSYRPGSAA